MRMTRNASWRSSSNRAAGLGLAFVATLSLADLGLNHFSWKELLNDGRHREYSAGDSRYSKLSQARDRFQGHYAAFGQRAVVCEDHRLFCRTLPGTKNRHRARH